MLDRQQLLSLIDEMAASHKASAGQISALLSCEDEEVINYLFSQALAVKEAVFGRDIYIRAIIEFSNVCRCACRYCGINRENQNIIRYQMPAGEILGLAYAAIDAGYQTIVLQSGEDLSYTREMLGAVIRKIKAYAPAVAVTLSVGERPYGDYAHWRVCGADRYLIKHETADVALYEKLHPGHSLEKRLDCQQHLQALGYEMGSGFMVGLPGQTMEMLAEDILLLQKMQVAMAGIGPFIPHPDTSLAGAAKGDIALTNRVLAITRLLLPTVHLPATTALTVQGGRAEALAAGADVIMQKATPAEKQRLYEIYPRPVKEEYSLKEKRQLLVTQLKSLGYMGI
ncbi:MAG: [FeFe] hydrogenase H-cluster radical SAM maturase HydE [Peptococcaceae bacterium]|nr:[FeFe] hydrogenase H-cluster radical SAM maturase HydE [Peptococcaceae bacterium]